MKKFLAENLFLPFKELENRCCFRPEEILFKRMAVIFSKAMKRIDTNCIKMIYDVFESMVNFIFARRKKVFYLDIFAFIGI